MKTKLQSMLKDRRGAITVEYIVLIGVLALLLIVGVSALRKAEESKLKEQGNKVAQIGQGS